MTKKQKPRHLATHQNFHNDIKWNDHLACPVFDVKLDKAITPSMRYREILHPIVINPDRIRSHSFMIQGINSSNQKCLLMAVASSVAIQQEVRASHLADPNFLPELRKTVFKNSKKKKSKRENFLKIGLCDSSQDSVGKLAVHCIHTENTSNSKLKSLQFSSPFRTKISETFMGKCQKLTGCLESVLKKHVCCYQGNTQSYEKWESHQKECMEVQTEFTGHKPVLTENMHGTTNIAHLKGEAVTPTHLDKRNAPIELGGPPDSHICLTHNPNIGMLVYLPTGDRYLRPVIVQQTKYATTYFYAGSFYHGSVHIGTYLDEYCKMVECTL